MGVSMENMTFNPFCGTIFELNKVDYQIAKQWKRKIRSELE